MWGRPMSPAIIMIAMPGMSVVETLNAGPRRNLTIEMDAMHLHTHSAEVISFHFYLSGFCVFTSL